jgi:hypothetical protein
MTDEKPLPTRTDQAQQVAEEYAGGSRAIIDAITKNLRRPH